MCLLHDYRYIESSRKLRTVVTVFILISVVFIIYNVICSNENPFPNFAVTLSVITSIIFRCVFPIVMFFIDKTVGGKSGLETSVSNLVKSAHKIPINLMESITTAQNWG